MEKCEYRMDCLPERFPGWRSFSCPPEESDAIETCQFRKLMECGHPRLYLKFGRSRNDRGTCWCTKCKEEEGQ